MKMRVTLITEILDNNGRPTIRIEKADEMPIENPRFITRQAHRIAEACSDDTRQMLQPHYGEVDEKWIPANWKGQP